MLGFCKELFVRCVVNVVHELEYMRLPWDGLGWDMYGEGYVEDVVAPYVNSSSRKVRVGRESG